MACKGGNAEGCFHAGQMKMGTDEDVVKGGVKPNVKEGIAQLEKACKLGLADGCFDASCHYLQGTQGLEKDEKRAFSYAKRACEDFEPMHMESCNTTPFVCHYTHILF
jgi:TPR repeat protein